jgi:hypothetical protein
MPGNGKHLGKTFDCVVCWTSLFDAIRTCLMVKKNQDLVSRDQWTTFSAKGVDKVLVLQWMPLNGITLGQTIIDPIIRMIPITEYISYTNYAIGRHLGLDQSGLVWSH